MTFCNPIRSGPGPEGAHTMRPLFCCLEGEAVRMSRVARIGGICGIRPTAARSGGAAHFSLPVPRRTAPAPSPAHAPSRPRVRTSSPGTAPAAPAPRRGTWSCLTRGPGQPWRTARPTGPAMPARWAGAGAGRRPPGVKEESQGGARRPRGVERPGLLRCPPPDRPRAPGGVGGGLPASRLPCRPSVSPPAGRQGLRGAGPYRDGEDGGVRPAHRGAGRPRRRVKCRR